MTRVVIAVKESGVDALLIMRVPRNIRGCRCHRLRGKVCGIGCSDRMNVLTNKSPQSEIIINARDEYQALCGISYKLQYVVRLVK